MDAEAAGQAAEVPARWYRCALTSASQVQARITAPVKARTPALLAAPPVAIPAGTTTLTLLALPGPKELAPSDPRQASLFLASLLATALPTYLTSSR